MEIDKKLFISSIALALLLGGFLTYALTTDSVFHVHREPQVNYNVVVLAEKFSGHYQLGAGNLITNLGENYIRNTLGWDNVTNFNATQWISVSNDATPLVTWTKLANEVNNASGFGRRANTTCAAWNNGTDYAYNVTTTFYANGSQTLQCAGLQWSPTEQSDNNLMAAATFTQTAFSSGENLTVTWVMTFDAN